VSSTNNVYVYKHFAEHFWGEKINGFDVLCQNLKHSLASVKELETFVREGCACEDTYGKSLNKLVAQVNKFSGSNGTFAPVWQPLKELNERYTAVHVQQVHQLQELIRDIQKYNEELGKRIKKIRENETQTQNVVQNFQEITQVLNKSKEQYHNLCAEFEKQKRLLDAQQLAQYLQLSQQQQISTSNLLGMSFTLHIHGYFYF
jgi:DNA repair exonuclease SbcCD ATPase subunit